MPSLLNRVGSSRSSMSSKEHKCTVQLMDDSQTITVDFKKDDIGQVVLDYVCDMLNVVEKDYFGLRYVDSNRHRYWLDTSKPILKQIKGGSPIVFAFRVKFYPIDASVVYEQLTRYLITLQLKRDLLHGRLYCPQNEAAILGAYIVQSELGDYDPAEHKGNYVSQFKMFLNQTPRVEERIAVEHQKFKGQGLTATECDTEFLKKACTLETYGYYPFTVKDTQNGQVYIGATPRGLLIYQAHKKLHHLKWDDLRGFDYSGKEFFIYTTPEYLSDNNLTDEAAALMLADSENVVSENGENGVNISSESKKVGVENKNSNKKKPALRYVCPSSTFCKHLWKYMLAEEAFFTKVKSDEVKPVTIRRGLVFRKSTFRYTGRVLQEIKDAPSPKRAEPAFQRVHAQRQLPRDERNAPWANKFHTLPRSMKTVPEEHTNEISHNRDTLLLDTTSQSTPINTPMSGLSPSSENGGAWSTILANGPNQSYTIVQTTTTTTSNAKTMGGVGGVGGYQSEVITETQRHAEVSIRRNSAQQQQFPKMIGDGLQKENGQYRVNSMDDPISVIESNQPTIIVTESGNSGAFFKSVIMALMFLILILITIIIVMEIQDVEFRKYVRQITGDDAFRINYYDPWRQRVVDGYRRMFP